MLPARRRGAALPGAAQRPPRCQSLGGRSTSAHNPRDDGRRTRPTGSTRAAGSSTPASFAGGDHRPALPLTGHPDRDVWPARRGWRSAPPATAPTTSRVRSRHGSTAAHARRDRAPGWAGAASPSSSSATATLRERSPPTARRIGARRLGRARGRSRTASRGCSRRPATTSPRGASSTGRAVRTPTYTPWVTYAIIAICVALFRDRRGAQLDGETLGGGMFGGSARPARGGSTSSTAFAGRRGRVVADLHERVLPPRHRSPGVQHVRPVPVRRDRRAHVRARSSTRRSTCCAPPAAAF